MPKKKPNQIDVLVGRNVRLYRLHAKLSQTVLGERIGVTFQQVQKYERGSNRVGASRLAQIASALGVPITAFFEGIKHSPTIEAGDMPLDLIADAQALKLAKAFAEISDAALRRTIVQFVRQIAHKVESPK
jgi:transcriptional regulator with XRE-family HTH domain